ncbi:MAG: hypothetical protein ACRETJ_13080 [Steroidobacteraceae bacterium]
MTEQKRIMGLAEQIKFAQHYQEQWPDWLRSTAHFSGSNHASDLGSADEGAAQDATRNDDQTADA